jgi:pSer/pThr/pTyr-binding forkhead associated (FHA) protein
MLTTPHASRRHAKLTLSNGVLRVEDLNSANGTFVNGEKVVTAVIKDGDIVRFDMQEFTVIGSKDAAKTMLRPAAKPKKAIKKAPRRKSPAEKSSPKKVAAKKTPRKKVVAEEALPIESPPVEPPSVAPPSVAPPSVAPPSVAPPSVAPPLVELPSVEPTAAATPAIESQSEERPAGVDDLIGEATGSALNPRMTQQATRKVESDDLHKLLAEQGATRIMSDVARVKTPSLVGTTGAWSGKIIDLNRDVMTIGRTGVDIPLDEPSVSTKHAQIIKLDDQWKVVDLMSANGVFVNGKKTQASFLKSGDIVRFGRLELQFTIDAADMSSAAANDMSSAAANGEAQIMTDPGPVVDNKIPAWLYVAIGFAVVFAIGGYMLFSR